MNQATPVTEIELGNLFAEQARAISVPEQTKKKPEQCSPLTECGFNPNVVGKVYPAHIRHREDAEFHANCVLCVQAGRRVMTLRNWDEIDDAAEQKLLRLVQRGDKDACMFYLKRKQRDETLWHRVRVLLGI